MTHEYDDAISPEAFDQAVAMTLRLGAAAPGLPLSTHVEEAIHRSFCSCVVDVEDEIENGLSGTHAVIFGEVRQRVQRILDDQSPETTSQCVDLASEQSFPASDPPAWIHRAR